VREERVLECGIRDDGQVGLDPAASGGDRSVVVPGLDLRLSLAVMHGLVELDAELVSAHVVQLPNTALILR
jgi:hypothetical protein